MVYIDNCQREMIPGTKKITKQGETDEYMISILIPSE